MKQTAEELIREMTDRIVNAMHPIKVILFGSYARGEAGKDSDVDLLVVMPAIRNKREDAIAVRRILADLPVGKDIILTTPEELERRGAVIGSVLHPALREGKILYERA